ncbi:MAG: 3-methyl-2-oxobutanoate hydroxymethyltransferase [Gammaproteobacteria bacterium]|nr:3-methyl-2-oxobutanoate hydroxymethyltransferase [Gammaproteobacteria bacterium]
MPNKTITVKQLLEMKQAGRKISCLTSYDASFTQLAEDAGVELLLVGDSLGMVVQGRESTLPVTLDEMIYHTRNVARVRQSALIVADMPFMSYRTPVQALESAGRLMKEGGAQMVKLEGGASQLESVRQLSSQGIPVCGHLGLQPQSVHKLGGYRVQGRGTLAADAIKGDARALEQAGIDLLVLECVPSGLAAEVTQSLTVPVIGIGAGAATDGQVLVIYDILGMNLHHPRFVKNYLVGGRNIQQALAAFVQEVRDGVFPDEEHSYQ